MVHEKYSVAGIISSGDESVDSQEFEIIIWDYFIWKFS